MNKLIKFKSGFKTGKVDRENNIIHGMTLIQANREALGHEMFIDEKFVRSVVKQGKETGDIGLKARFDHPSACFSSMGTQIGRFKSFRMNGDKALADLHLAPFAFESNPNGNLGEFLMDAAENDPDIMGNSIVFSMAEPQMFKAGEGDDIDSPEFMYPHARLNSLLGCDVVDEGAATDGMFSIKGRPNYLAEQAEHFLAEHKDVVRALLAPTIKELFTEINDNINQNQSKMSDEKSLKDGFKEFYNKHFSSPEVEEVVEVIETPEANKDLEAAKTELASNVEEIEALKAEISKGVSALEAATTEFNDKVKANDEAVLAIKADFEAFKSESIGSLTDDVASTDDSVNLSEEAKESRKEDSKKESTSFWINEGFPSANNK